MSNEEKIIEYASSSVDVYKLFVDHDLLIVYSTLMGYDQIVKDLKAIDPRLKIINYMDFRGEPQRQIYGDGMASYNEHQKTRSTAKVKEYHQKKAHKFDETHIHPTIDLDNDSHQTHYEQSVNYSKESSHPSALKVLSTIAKILMIYSFVSAAAFIVFLIPDVNYEFATVFNHYAVVESGDYIEDIVVSKDMLEPFRKELPTLMYVGFNMDGQIKDIRLDDPGVGPYYYCSNYFDEVEDTTISKPVFVPLPDNYYDEEYVYVSLNDDHAHFKSIDEYESIDFRWILFFLNIVIFITSLIITIITEAAKSKMPKVKKRS